MGICKIKIRNYKSAKKIDYDISKNNINCLLGKNGVGKSTIDNAVLYFYSLAQNPYDIKNVIDKRNPYIQSMSIEVCYDLGTLYALNDYTEKAIEPFEEFIVENRYLTIKVTQQRNRVVEWYPKNDCKIVANFLKLYPVYLLSTKNVDEKAWLSLWDVVTDIAVTGIRDEKESIKSILADTFEKVYGSKYREVYEIVDEILEKENVSLNELQYKKRFKYALLTNLGGDAFMLDEESVDYYSDGINALKYLELQMKLLSKLSTISYKEIVVILDEPEINMHPQYVQDLARVILDTSKDLKYILSTHSTKLVSSLIAELDDVDNYLGFNQVFFRDYYSCIKQLPTILENTDKYLVKECEAESYFANAVVFVEGQTEMQLLQNKYIVELFPCLKKVTLYNTSSNDSVTKLIIPNTTGPAIPYLVVIDMDKVLKSSAMLPGGTTEFSIKNGNRTVNPLWNEKVVRSEKYYYSRKKRSKTIAVRNTINSYLQKPIKVDQAHYYNTESWFDVLIKKVKQYCSEYRTIVFKTTVEGAVICEESLKCFKEWLMSQSPRYDKFLKALEKYSDKSQVTILRLVFHGKTDYLYGKTRQEGKTQYDSVPKPVKSLIDSVAWGKKTDGWLFDFFAWYFKNVLVDEDEEDEDEKKNRKKKAFIDTFPEIGEVVFYIENMVR